MNLKLYQLLGKGSFGSVFLGDFKNDTLDLKHVAIKQIPLKNKRSEAKVEEELKYLKKAQSLDDASNPHFVKFYVAFEKDDNFYIVMDYDEAHWKDVMSNEFEKLLKKNSKKYFNKFFMLATHLLKGLQILHSQCIIHADIKPDNLLMHTSKSTEKSNLVYSDFGLSCFKKECIRKGTPMYMHPQMFFKGKKASIETDIYALFLTLYEILFDSVFYDFDEMPIEEDYEDKFDDNMYTMKSQLEDLIASDDRVKRILTLFKTVLDPSKPLKQMPSISGIMSFMLSANLSDLKIKDEENEICL